ncbi:methyltransferase domain-containing protein [Paenibacillus aurantius]|uniref:Methyltransferase domain-containing protein n=1 Tax=Paenibacillus aurantius TaxID=2918900 RepID=A0AA96REC8_9BACL|nr:methyltransferase domain-containing protein [Paenibacillus aurantius]WNQ10737.1 methyltransferase domain-containing protein [Paenibacillus aurantius]
MAESSLRCVRGHSFDIARQGYVNFLSKPSPATYDHRLFEARRRMARTGLFQPLETILGRLILEASSGPDEPVKVLDAGCGEGSQLARIREGLSRSTARPVLTVGMDLAKEGIRRAAGEYPQSLWCVADLANAPLADGAFTVLLNVLSPANYSEFRRITAAGGRVIKVLPGQDYLKELRTILYEGSPRQQYSNERTAALFRENLRETQVQQVRYQVKLEEDWLESLLRMTPLSWGIKEESLHEVKLRGVREITMDYVILTGRSE